MDYNFNVLPDQPVKKQTLLQKITSFGKQKTPVTAKPTSPYNFASLPDQPTQKVSAPAFKPTVKSLAGITGIGSSLVKKTPAIKPKYNLQALPDQPLQQFRDPKSKADNIFTYEQTYAKPNEEQEAAMQSEANVRQLRADPRSGDLRIEAFVEGLLPLRGKKDLPPDLDRAFPLSTAMGSLAGLIGVGVMTGGVAPAITHAKYLQAVPTVARLVGARMAQTAATFGSKELIDQLSQAIGGDEKQVGEVAKSVGKQALVGAGLGGIGAVSSPLLRIPLEMGYGFTLAKMEGASNLEAGVNGAIFGLFGLFNAKNLSNVYKAEAYKGAKKAMVDRMTTAGMEANKAEVLAERYFQYALKKAGGMEKATPKDFDTFSKAMRRGDRIVLDEVVAQNVKPQAKAAIPQAQAAPTTPSEVAPGSALKQQQRPFNEVLDKPKVDLTPPPEEPPTAVAPVEPTPTTPTKGGFTEHDRLLEELFSGSGIQGKLIKTGEGFEQNYVQPETTNVQWYRDLFAANKGIKKADIATAVKKHKAGKPLTKIQQALFDKTVEVFKSKSTGTLEEAYEKSLEKQEAKDYQAFLDKIDEVYPDEGANYIPFAGISENRASYGNKLGLVEYEKNNSAKILGKDYWVTITPSIKGRSDMDYMTTGKQPKMFQVTIFNNKNEPLGDEQIGNWDEAIKQALNNAVVPRKEYLQAIVETGITDKSKLSDYELAVLESKKTLTMDDYKKQKGKLVMIAESKGKEIVRKAAKKTAQVLAEEQLGTKAEPKKQLEISGTEKREFGAGGKGLNKKPEKQIPQDKLLEDFIPAKDQQLLFGGIAESTSAGYEPTRYYKVDYKGGQSYLARNKSIRPSGSITYDVVSPAGGLTGRVITAKPNEIIEYPARLSNKYDAIIVGVREQDKVYDIESVDKTKLPAFMKWFEGSKVVDAEGDPLPVYHGTTREFNVFNKDLGNPNNDLGVGFYFTSSEDDAVANYHSTGADLKIKIDTEAERLQNDPDFTDELESRGITELGDIMREAERVATRKYMGDTDKTISAYLALKNPVIIGGKGETIFTFDMEKDEEGEFTGEESGTLIDLMETFKSVVGDMEDAGGYIDKKELDNVVSKVFQEAVDWEGLKASELVKIIKDSGFAFSDENGEYPIGDIIRRTFEDSGYDGIIDNTVFQKFGYGARKHGNLTIQQRGMSGVESDTTHYIAFKPNQIKSVDNRGTFNPADPDILREPTRLTPVKKYARLSEKQLSLFPDEMEAAYGSKEKAKTAIYKAAEDIDNVRPLRRNTSQAQRKAPSKIAEELRRRGFIDHVGRKINNTQDVAELSLALRIPHIEQLQAIYVKDGVVLAHQSLTSGMPGYVSPKSNKVLVYKMISAAKRLGATEVYLAHNHPNGIIKPSQPDMGFTEAFFVRMKKQGIKLTAHVITNGDKYSVINPESLATLHRGRSKGYSVKSYTNPQQIPMKDVLDVNQKGFPKIEDVVAFAKEYIKGGKINILFADSANNTISIEAINYGKNLTEFVKQGLQKNLASYYYIIVGRVSNLGADILPKGLQDVIALQEDGQYLSVSEGGVRIRNFGITGLIPTPKEIDAFRVQEEEAPQFPINPEKEIAPKETAPKEKQLPLEGLGDITPTEQEAVDAYERFKDAWFGEKDVRVFKAKMTKYRLQQEVKAALKLNKYTDVAKDYDKAMQIYIDLKRNPEHLEKYFDKLTPEQQKIVKLSQDLPPELVDVADKISERYRNIGMEAKNQEIIRNVLDNYAARVWNQDPKPSMEVGRKFGAKTRHAKARVYDTILEGWANGEELKIEGATNNLQILEEEIVKTIADKKFINALTKIKTPTGDPLVSTRQLDGYVRIEHPNFTKWEYAGKIGQEGMEEADVKGRNFFITEDGTILEKKPLFAPKAQATNLNNILGISKLKGIPFVDAITKYNAIFKSWILQSSFFHHLAFTRSYMFGANRKQFSEMNPVAAYKKGLEAVTNLEPEIVRGVKNGLTLDRRQDWTEESLQEKTAIGKLLDKWGVTKAIKDKVLAFRQMQADFLFGEFGSGLKAMAYLIEYRNLVNEYPNADQDTLSRYAANLVNDDFGGLHLQRLGRNPTLQHIFRIFALAPDWTESNIRSFIKVFANYDTEVERKLYQDFYAGVFLKGIAVTVLGNMLMAALDSDDPETTGMANRFIRNYKKAWATGNFRWTGVDITPIYKAFGGKTSRRKYFAPLGHFLDILKFIFHPIRSAHNKGSVVYRMFHEALVASNWQGKQFTSLPELIGMDYDKGYYKTTVKGKYKKGEPKFGKLRGQTVAWKFGGAKPLEFTQIPSYALAQLKGTQPVQIQNLFAFIAGEMEAFDAIASGMGLGVTSSYESEDEELNEDVKQAKKTGKKFVYVS